MKRDPKLLLREIVAAMSAIQRFTEGMASEEELLMDDKTASAVIRKFEIIGEAVRALPASFRDQHPEIPWSEMVAMRNRLIHGYFQVDFSLLWETIRVDMPRAKSQLQEILGERDSR